MQGQVEEVCQQEEERRVKTKRYPEAVSSLQMMGVSDLVSLSLSLSHTHTHSSFYDQMKSRVQALKAVREHSSLCLFSQDLNILANSRVPDSFKFCFCLFLMWTIFKSLIESVTTLLLIYALVF